jgi:hypothetical protein
MSSNFSLGISFLNDLGEFFVCPRKKCSGKMIPVKVKYVDGIIRDEWECTSCSKVMKNFNKLTKWGEEKYERPKNNSRWKKD